MHQNKSIFYIASVFLLIIFPTSASTTFETHELYKLSDNEDYYQRADIIAIVKTISGTMAFTEEKDENEIKVSSKVLIPIKGTQQAAELTIYGGAAEVNAEYMAILKWDKVVKGYRFLSPDMNHSIDKTYLPGISVSTTQGLSKQRIATIKTLNARSQSIIEDWVKETFGFQSEVIIHKNWFYFPDCKVHLQEHCERDFKRIQFMLKKLKK
ncbi:MAG: hypothetical protein CSA79_02090 [Thiothrix nivea]|nr:MAG: hypothetical protein CSA79_02090 [Thiothrix nivea]